MDLEGHVVVCACYWNRLRCYEQRGKEENVWKAMHVRDKGLILRGWRHVGEAGYESTAGRLVSGVVVGGGER